MTIKQFALKQLAEELENLEVEREKATRRVNTLSDAIAEKKDLIRQTKKAQLNETQFFYAKGCLYLGPNI